jgi:predicted RNA-binding Zn-ribbon protein involved in translation (DUF1610 family)
LKILKGALSYSGFDNIVKDDLVGGKSLLDYVNQYGSAGTSMYVRELRKDVVCENSQGEKIAISDIPTKITNVRRASSFRCPVCGEYFHRFKTEYEAFNNHKMSNKILLFNKKIKSFLKLSESIVESMDYDIANVRLEKGKQNSTDLTNDAYVKCLEHVMEHSFWQKVYTWMKYKRLQPLRYSYGVKHPV